MSSFYAKRLSILALAAALIATALSAVWRVPYIFTLIAMAALVAIGHLVTVDDDMPGGWSNQDGAHSFPWRELLVKVAIVVALGLLAALSPGIRSLGGR